MSDPLRKALTRAAVAVLLAALVALPAAALPKVGSVAPAFTGKTVAGKALKLSQYKGKVVVLNFFSRY